MQEIFVFGSNLMGIHKRGAALDALRQYGAFYGQGVGLQGSSYAIPTKESPYRSLSLYRINTYVAKFLEDAHCLQDDLVFRVTAIGCGLAGYTPRDIGPMFRMAQYLPNVILPQEFQEFVNG